MAPGLAAVSGQGVSPGGLTAVYGLAVSADDRTLAAASADGTLRLWDLPSERLRATIFAGGHPTRVAFSPDGRLLAVGSGGNFYLAVGSGGNFYLTTGVTYSVNDVWSVYDVASGRLLYQLAPPQLGVNNVAFSPDGRLLALAQVDGTIQLWAVPRTPAGRWLPAGAPLRADPSWLVALAFSPDGRLLASGGSDGTIQLWDMAHRRQVGAPLAGHTDVVFALAFNRQGTLLASASNDQTIRLWDVPRRRPVGLPLASQTQLAVAFSTDGTLLATGGGDVSVNLWDVGSGQPVGSGWTGSLDHSATNVVFSPDGTRLFASGDDGSIRVWNVDLRGWPRLACQIANRNLTHKEWLQYLPGVPYEETCPGLPPGA
jgi:WD40 repeat protein